MLPHVQPRPATTHEGDRSSVRESGGLPLPNIRPIRAAGSGLSKPTVGGSNPPGLPGTKVGSAEGSLATTCPATGRRPRVIVADAGSNPAPRADPEITRAGRRAWVIAFNAIPSSVGLSAR